MKLPINLASQPYENVRPLYSGLLAASVLLILLSFGFVWTLAASRGRTRVLAERSAQLDRETALLASEQSELSRWLARPEVQDIRNRADYLNAMIVRKSLSWTQLFMDLEKVLPNQVQVTNIHPGLSNDKQPQLTLSVSALTLPPLIQFLKNLESSTRFDKPYVASTRYPAERAQDPSIGLDLEVDYRPEGEEQSDVVGVAEMESASTVPVAPKGNPAVVVNAAPPVAKPAPVSPPMQKPDMGSKAPLPSAMPGEAPRSMPPASAPPAAANPAAPTPGATAPQNPPPPSVTNPMDNPGQVPIRRMPRIPGMPSVLSPPSGEGQ